MLFSRFIILEFPPSATGDHSIDHQIQCIFNRVLWSHFKFLKRGDLEILIFLIYRAACRARSELRIIFLSSIISSRVVFQPMGWLEFILLIEDFIRRNKQKSKLIDMWRPPYSIIITASVTFMFVTKGIY